MNERSYVNTQIQANIEVLTYERWFITYELMCSMYGSDAVVFEAPGKPSAKKSCADLVM
ncbi:MAG: hypothetical protein HQL05_03665 [Nitrospirae bacterium]|uniref:hypothetical protein n=1 Tax=Candidatus Magnetobacterium casense TaxID=1455061 RepID=UPI0012DDE360|nr:hypothetical protein [Candidatus Magnetobacterium casensis]MBF0336906.1 hypothetical protein [Nitrospirota bacterium]